MTVSNILLFCILKSFLVIKAMRSCRLRPFVITQLLHSKCYYCIILTRENDKAAMCRINQVDYEENLRYGLKWMIATHHHPSWMAYFNVCKIHNKNKPNKYICSIYQQCFAPSRRHTQPSLLRNHDYCKIRELCREKESSTQY